MKLYRVLCVAIALQMFAVANVQAGDFGWLQELEVHAKADPSGFRTSLATRFRVGNADITAVIGDVRHPADAYMVLRLGEISHQPVDYVLRQYRANEGKGWGALAKSLGIKPGSSEFHALKAGHDLQVSGGGKHSAGSKYARHEGGKENKKGGGKNKQDGKGKGKPH